MLKIGTVEALILSINYPVLFFRHVSFVDCPGQGILMATMLKGAAVMDAALLLIGMNFGFTENLDVRKLFLSKIRPALSLGPNKKYLCLGDPT